MLMKEIRIIVKKRNVDPGKMTKKNLIRAIQSKEKNSACFHTALEFCDQNDCCWRSDCKPGKTR